MRDLLDRLAGHRVLVVGDIMLDRSVVGPAARISPEAPVPVVSIEYETEGLGGAANVAAGIRALGATPVLVGATGSDAAYATIIELLGAADIDPEGIVTIDGRPTTVKTRIIARHQQVARVDREVNEPVPTAGLIAAVDTAFAGGIDAVALSDYAKGVLGRDLIRHVIDGAARRNVPVIVDPKGDDPGRYRGATLVTPNLAEFTSWIGARLHHTDVDALAEAGSALARDNDIANVAVTLGGSGILRASASDEPCHVPGRPIEVFDVTGAGDSVVAAIASALAAGLRLDEAIELGNVAGAVAVGRSGTSVVSRSDLARELDLTASATALDRTELLARVARWKARDQRVVFTNGCFDVLHAGHVAVITAARRAGDVLVIGLNSDESVRRLKGHGRPVTTEADRAAMLAALRGVDAVVVFDEDDPLKLIEAIAPDVLVKGGDYRREDVIGAAFVERNGGRVVIVPTKSGYSTTDLLARVRKA